MRRVTALAGRAYLVWLLLTWTRTLEQQLAGIAVALCVAAVLAPLGDVAAPWRLLDPRRLVAVVRLAAVAFAGVLRSNIDLARRVWAPSRPLRSGMVVVPTAERTDAGLAATGLITSLIVENQIVDLDRDRHELQYHAIDVPHGNRRHPEGDINAPIERLLAPVLRRP
jgi:multicomponent Na+:H+ antiporter subunit E